jgi:hypothetical protein
MIPDHECHAFNFKTLVIRQKHKRKMDWKKLKREPKYEAVWQRTCSICGKILEEGPVPELVGWTVDWSWI